MTGLLTPEARMTVADAGFSAALAEWHDVFLMVATGAASLLGFFGVAISLNLEILRRDDKSHLRLLANQTFYSFLRVFVIATTLLVPHPNPVALGVVILLISLQGLADFAAQPKARIRTDLASEGRPHIVRFLWRALVPIVCNAIVAVASVPLALGNGRILYVVLGAAIAALVTATRNAWDLLVAVSNDSGTNGAAP